MTHSTLIGFKRLAQPVKFLSVVALVTLWASTAQSQQILFDFNNPFNTSLAGNDVMQTELVGGDNFELTASYTSGGGANLFDVAFGGGDFAFFSNGPVPDPAQFRLSLTQNGVATRFTLNQIDFASFGSGISFDLLDDGGNLITNDFAIPDNTGGPAPTGSISIDNVANATDVLFIDVVGSGINSTVFTDFDNIIVTPTAIPEPNGLYGLALLSIGILVRRKRR